MHSTRFLLRKYLQCTVTEETGSLSSVQLLSCVRPYVTPWTVAHQASLSITNSCSLLKLKFIESVMPSITLEK